MHNKSPMDKDCDAKCPTNLEGQPPMKVLALGLGRTGTTSLNAAFCQLGLKPYDIVDRAVLGHLPQWTEALQWKYHGKGPAWGREKFDTLMNGFDAVLDTPCCLFVDELITAYPDAKVILTTRDVDKWHKSVTATIFRFFARPSWRILQYTDRLAGEVWRFDKALWDCVCDGDKGDRAKQAFIDHNNHVRKVVPPERLLEFHPGDGWGPLCQFLDVPEPETPFPMKNDSGQWQADMEAFWMRCVKRSIRNVGMVVIGIAVVYGIRKLSS